MTRFSPLTFFAIAVLAPGTIRAEFGELAQPFLERHCLRCHNDEKQKGDFRLDTLSRDFTNQSAAERWAEVIFRVNSGEMPPEDETQPEAAEIETVVDFLNSRIEDGRAARMAKRGPVTHYRLSRDEYAATVYDLLGVHYDVHQPGAFTEDPRWHGYERIGALLSLSPSHVNRYFAAAEAVLEQAFPKKLPKPETRRIDAVDLRHRGQREEFEKLGIAGKVRALLWQGKSMGAISIANNPGLYRIRIQLSGLQPEGGMTPHLSIWDPKLKETIYDEDVIAPEHEPAVIEFETFLTPPIGLQIQNNVAGAFNDVGNHTLNVLNGGGSVFLGTDDHRMTNPTGYKLVDDEGKPMFPLLIVDWVEWEGPLVSEEDLRKREGLFPAGEGNLAQAAETLRTFATRAWRRPATEPEIAPYLGIIESELAAGENFRTAYLAAMTGVLASSHFYYLKEGSAEEPRENLTSYELASRLSYFLWGSMPDDELFASAAAGELDLKAQTARLMADPKMERFAETFPRQWLQLHRLGQFPPDRKLYPSYDLWLEKSMALETTHFFAEVLRQNLSLREFLASDWTMANPRLALHYELPPLSKSGFQRVSLRPDHHRGGLLTQAAMLSLTSDGTRHRPVHRGVLVSESIFGKTPPPPPPNVEPLEPTGKNEPKETIRQQLEAHATHATCASCHRKIDPLGFAFDNYDAIGRWRTEEVSATGKGENPPVVSNGEMPDGRAFDGPAQFKQLLVEDIDVFAEAFIEQLATFALRRVMTIDDRAQIKAIAERGKADDYRLRSVIENFVTSELFQTR